uniref:Uncharacterized protein n=1 Tax=Molossus molossus TaxID=27622 RepID=A0A7J8FAF7_MOLMO|nr:hypothetical protein HJG59_008493 [Molossus molossus]
MLLILTLFSAGSTVVVIRWHSEWKAKVPPVTCRDCQGITQPRAWSAAHMVSRLCCLAGSCGPASGRHWRRSLLPLIAPPRKDKAEPAGRRLPNGRHGPQRANSCSYGCGSPHLDQGNSLGTGGTKLHSEGLGRSSQQGGGWTAGCHVAGRASSRAAGRLQRSCAASGLAPASRLGSHSRALRGVRDSIPAPGPQPKVLVPRASWSCLGSLQTHL